MKDTPAFFLTIASSIFIVGPGVALLALDLDGVCWHIAGVTLVVLGLVSWTFWTVRNYRDWRSEFPRTRRKRGKTHKAIS